MTEELNLSKMLPQKKGAAMDKSTSKQNTRRGFSIVEVVIAMTVITIVCFATLTIILSSNLSTARAVKRQQAQFFAEDVVNCFRVTADENSFKQILPKSIDLKEGESIEQDQEIALSLEGYTLNYKIDGTKISVTITEEGDKVIAKVEYTKR
jgi:Tfp pilus assembly protein PilV